MNILDPLSNTAEQLRKKISFKFNPYILALIIFLIFAFVAFHFSRDYGITWDEPVQNAYGLAVYQWYRSFGKDTSFLFISNLRFYGPFFEVITAFFQNHFHHMWYARTLINICGGLVGIIAIWLCCYEIKKPWLGLIAVLLIILFPRYSGDIYANSKDIPLAAAYTLVLWSVLHLISNWNKRYYISSILVGILLGISSAIRVISVIWWGILPTIVVIYWLGYILKNKGKIKSNLSQIKKTIIKQLISGIIIYAISFGTMTLLWPYIFLSPIHNFIESLTLMSHFSVSPTAVMPFQGKLVSQMHPPRDYTLVWLFIATPIATIFFWVWGIGRFIYNLLQKKEFDKYLGICLLAIIIPLSAIIILDSTLYNALRQFLFIVPPMLIFAAYGMYDLFVTLKNKKVLLVFLILLTLGSYLNVIYTEAQLHPYEYVYFNELVGGLKGATGYYETEYWGASFKYCAGWLGTNYVDYTKLKYIPIDAQTTDKVQIMNFLPPNFYVDSANPMFIITLIRNQPSDFNTKSAGMKDIHTEGRYGQTFCKVVYNPQYKT